MTTLGTDDHHYSRLQRQRGKGLETAQVILGAEPRPLLHTKKKSEYRGKNRKWEAGGPIEKKELESTKEP